MKKTTLEKIKKSLLEQKEELKNKIYPDEIDIEGDETDIIQGKIIALVTSKLSLRDRDKINQIDNALKKIELQTYGSCEDCEEPIAERRLEVNPHCSNCIACAEIAEYEEKQARLR